MEFAERVEERMSVPAIVTDLGDLKDKLLECRGSLANIPRIPNVVHSSKEYSNFSIAGSFSAAAVLILLSKDACYNSVSVELVLNINYFSYFEILEKLIDPNLIPYSYETVGNIIHLNLTEEQNKVKKIIGAVLNYKTGCTVINKVGNINNIYRNYGLEVIAGEKKLKTVHNENGVKIVVDLENVYWCSRLQNERSKIIEELRENEVLCDPFCGVGPLVLPALKKKLKVFANDLNPEAIKCLNESLKINKLKCENVSCMDAGDFVRSLSSYAINHFVFNLPQHSLEYLRFLRGFRNFKLHCFFFHRVSDDLVTAAENTSGFRINPNWLREVRKVSPSKLVIKMEVFSEELFEYQQDSISFKQTE